MVDPSCTLCGNKITAEQSADIEGRCPECSGRILKSYTETTAPSRPTDEVSLDEIEEHLRNLATGKKSFRENLVILVVSVLLFIGAGLLDQSLSGVLVLILVLFVHEAGHFVGMKLFGYRDVRIFFIPLLGAATAGTATNPSGAKRVIVSLLGPLPGIVIGIVCWGLYFQTHNEALLQPARAFLILNAFNLLPFHPLDGGQLVDELIFSRHPLLELLFKLLACLALIGTAFLLKWPILGIVAALLLFTLKGNYQRAVIAYHLQKVIPAEEQLPGSIPRQYLVQIKELLDEKFSAIRVGAKAMAIHIDLVWQRICLRRPSALVTFALIALYLGSLFIALVSPFLFEAVRSKVVKSEQTALPEK